MLEPLLPFQRCKVHGALCEISGEHASLRGVAMKMQKMSKFLLAVVTAASMSMLSTAASAHDHLSGASGVVHYEAGNQLVTRDVTMTMERLSDQEASFSLSSGDWSIETRQAFMRTSRGAQIAYVGFENAWRMDDKSVHLLFKGVKLRGENGMVYQGTLYKTTPEQLALSGETFEQCLQKIKEQGTIDEEWQIAGTFYLKK